MNYGKHSTMMNESVQHTNAASHHLALCLACHHLNDYRTSSSVTCSRCGAHVHIRKPYSLVRAWFYVALAFCLMIPANVLPIMTILQFNRGEPSTIIGGVVLLMHYHIYGIALVIFVASFLIPLGKLLGLTVLLTSLQFDLGMSAHNRTRAYRVIEFLGRWSMLDIFVVALLVGLVQLGQIVSIEPNPGAISFGAVVVITILAAHSFDPRLIWDNTHEG